MASRLVLCSLQKLCVLYIDMMNKAFSDWFLQFVLLLQYFTIFPCYGIVKRFQTCFSYTMCFGNNVSKNFLPGNIVIYFKYIVAVMLSYFRRMWPTEQNWWGLQATRRMALDLLTHPVLVVFFVCRSLGVMDILFAYFNSHPWS